MVHFKSMEYPFWIIVFHVYLGVDMEKKEKKIFLAFYVTKLWGANFKLQSYDYMVRNNNIVMAKNKKNY